MKMLLLAFLVLDPPSESRIPTSKGDLVVRPVNHASFVMQWDGKTVFVDPVQGADTFKPFGAPDLILITDIHGDHLKADAVKAVATDATTIVGPPAVVEKLGEAERAKASAMKNGETLVVNVKGGTIEIRTIPMYNLTEERKGFHAKGRGNGYVVKFGDKRVYISGDTEDIPEMRGLKEIDAAFVCMNLPYTMTVDQAASAVLEFKPKIVFPYHYRGKDGMSDVGRFKSLVEAGKSVEVRLLKWYDP